MQAAFDNAVEYIHDREQFGQPVGTFQLMQGLSFRSPKSHNGIEKQFLSENCGHVHQNQC
jgi:isovaleryl-CoA dehydrogenase